MVLDACSAMRVYSSEDGQGNRQPAEESVTPKEKSRLLPEQLLKAKKRNQAAPYLATTQKGAARGGVPRNEGREKGNPPNHPLPSSAVQVAHSPWKGVHGSGGVGEKCLSLPEQALPVYKIFEKLLIKSFSGHTDIGGPKTFCIL